MFIYVCIGIKMNRGFFLGKDEGVKWKRLWIIYENERNLMSWLLVIKCDWDWLLIFDNCCNL